MKNGPSERERHVPLGRIAVVAVLVVGVIVPGVTVAAVVSSASVLLGGQVTTLSSCSPPSAPEDVVAQAGDNTVTLTWSAAAGNGSTVTAYVARELAGPDAGASVAVAGSALTATLTGLAGGTGAFFTVAAQSACGTGPVRTSVSVTPTGAASTYQGAVLADGPVAFYRLADPSGTVMADSSGKDADGSYSAHVTLNQLPALLSDPAPSAMFSTCCAVANASPSLPLGGSARTLEAWFETTSTEADQIVASYGTYSPNEAFVVTSSPQAISVDVGQGAVNFDTPRAVDDGSWHFVAVTVSGTTVSVYLDGKSIGTTALTTALDTSSGAFSVGDAEGVPAQVFAGQLADVAVFPTALAAADLTAQFDASGYLVPDAVVHVHVAFGGPNAAVVTWGYPDTDPAVTGYLVSALGAPAGKPTVAVSADATAVRLTGLAPRRYTFSVTPLSPVGAGPATVSGSFTVAGTATTYASAVLADDPSVFYRLDDSDLNVVADSSGNGQNGSYLPAFATLVQAGPLGNDPSTSAGDGPFGQLAEAPATLPLAASPRTVEGWVQTTNDSQSWLASYGNTNTDGSFTVSQLPNAVIVDDHTETLTFPSEALLDDGGWHFVAVTTDGTTVTVYVDGASIGTQSLTTPLNTVATSTGLTVGGGPDVGSEESFDGDLADVAVFPSVLSAAQVQAQFVASGLAVPSAPTSVTAVAGANNALISWAPPTTADPQVTGYIIGAARGPDMSVPATQTTATLTGLAGGKATTVTVRALNEYGAGATARPLRSPRPERRPPTRPP